MAFENEAKLKANDKTIGIYVVRREKTRKQKNAKKDNGTIYNGTMISRFEADKVKIFCTMIDMMSRKCEMMIGNNGISIIGISIIGISIIMDGIVDSVDVIINDVMDVVMMKWYYIAWYCNKCFYILDVVRCMVYQCFLDMDYVNINQMWSDVYYMNMIVGIDNMIEWYCNGWYYNKWYYISDLVRCMLNKCQSDIVFVKMDVQIDNAMIKKINDGVMMIFTMGLVL